MPLYVYFSDVLNILYVFMLWFFCLIFRVIQRLSHATAVLSPQHNSPRFRHLGAPTAWYTWGAILPGCLRALFRVRHTKFFRTSAVFFRSFSTQFIRHRRAINYDNHIRCAFGTLFAAISDKRVLVGVYLDLARSCRTCTVVLLECSQSFHTTSVLTTLF